jgi:hypothetical protein
MKALEANVKPLFLGYEQGRVFEGVNEFGK